MNNILLKDLFRYVGEDNTKLKTKLRYILFTPGFQYTYFLRKTQNAKNLIIKIFWMLFLRGCMFKTGIQIPYYTKIGEGLRIAHFGNIVINPYANIGKNFTIGHGCLIGSASGKKEGIPVIGNNVFMGANSIIIGGVRIGDFVMIAPGSFINFDVPSNSIVIGNPGKIIPSNRPTDKYNVYTV